MAFNLQISQNIQMWSIDYDGLEVVQHAKVNNQWLS